MTKTIARPIRRINVRDTVHIFKECLATLDLLRQRFEYVSTTLDSMNGEVYRETSVKAMAHAAVVQRAHDALSEVVELKTSIELPLGAQLSEGHQ